MAQRAYRQRKESTLEELRKRVSELTNMMELMNKAFTDCRDRLTASGLPAHSMQDMQETSTQYEALMKCVRNPGEECDPAVTQLIQQTSANSTNDPNKSIEPKNVPSWMDQAALHSMPKPRGNAVEVGMGYTMYSGDTAMEYAGFDPMSQALVPAKSPTPNSLDGFRIDIPAGFSMPPSISGPTTYSFQEGTFSRRLHRACLEQGYQLLLDPARRPHTYDRVFKLSLMGRDRGRLISAMKTLLARGPHETLNTGLLIHVGGAGTHYPPRDAYGNVQHKRESWHLGVVGPQTLALLENAARDNLTTDMTVEISGFEGEWFDPYDVEGYLNEKGIFIDPSTSFSEAEVYIWPEESSNASSSFSSATSPKTPEVRGADRGPPRPFDQDQLEWLSRFDAVPEEVNEFSTMNLTDIGFSDASTGSWMNFLQPGQGTKNHQTSNIEPTLANVNAWEGSQTSEFLNEASSARMTMFHKPANSRSQPREKKTIIIDINKFVKGRCRISTGLFVRLC